MRKDKRKKGKIEMMQDNENKRINAGYEIIATLPVGDVEFVVGQNVHDPAMFVTWEYQKQRSEERRVGKECGCV